MTRLLNITRGRDLQYYTWQRCFGGRHKMTRLPDITRDTVLAGEYSLEYGGRHDPSRNRRHACMQTAADGIGEDR
jgi:hypothetical protein